MYALIIPIVFILTKDIPCRNLVTPLKHSRDGVCSPLSPGQKRPVNTLVFLCPSKSIDTWLIRIKSIMVGCCKAVERLAVPGRYCKPYVQPASKKFAVLRGGLKSIPGDTAMNTCTQNPTTLSVSEICTHSELIDFSLIIGSIAESNGSFTAGLVRFINKIGKPLSELTVTELVTIIQDYREAFNAGTEPKLKHSLGKNEPPPKSMTSRFNVLAKSSHKLIAQNISFDQAKQFHNCIVKFSCMSSSGEEVAL